MRSNSVQFYRSSPHPLPFIRRADILGPVSPMILSPQQDTAADLAGTFGNPLGLDKGAAAL